MPNSLSELFAVDIAFGKHVRSAFADCSPTSGPSEFREFLTRPAKQQIFRNDNDTVAGFLANYMADAKSVTIATGQTPARSSTVLMPVAYYCRKPGLTTNDEAMAGLFNRWKTLFTDDGISAVKLKLLGLSLTYRLAFVSRDKASLDRMQMAWVARVSDVKAGGDRFELRYQINGIELPGARAIIRDPTSFSFTDESLTGEGGRFFAVGTTVEVMTPVLFGDSVQVVEPVTLEYEMDIMHGA